MLLNRRDRNMTNEEFFNSPYRGVTSVLNIIFGNKFENSGIPEHVLKAAAERGTACHSYIEKYQKWLLSDELKEEDEPHLGLEYAQYETNFKKWLEERCEIVQPILIEHKIISKKLGIKGIIDCVAEFQNKGEIDSFIALTDWKSSSNLDLWTTECQLQLYYLMLAKGNKQERLLAKRITELRCLSITKTGYRWFKFKIDKKLGEAILTLWNTHYREIEERR